MTLKQLARWYGLPARPTSEDLRILKTAAPDRTADTFDPTIVTRIVKLSQDDDAPWVEMQFVVADARTANLTWYNLRQLAALAEARLMEGQNPGAWKPTALQRRQPGEIKPDALYDSVYGLVYVELDSGQYGWREIDAHITAYAALGPQLWVVFSATQKRRIHDRLRILVPHRCDHRVLVARWWC